METKLPSRKPILIWLIVSQVLALASLVVWLLMAGLSVMAFDSGVTQEAWNFVIAVWLYPIWPIVFAIASWVAYWRKSDRLAGVLTTLTFLPILVLLLILVGANSFYFMTTYMFFQQLNCEASLWDCWKNTAIQSAFKI